MADPAAKDALAETQARISAIAGIHRRLYTSDDVRVVEIDDYLDNLVAEIETSMKPTASRADIVLDSNRSRMPTDKAVSIGVIVTELVTNALKYAYRDGQAGEIRVRPASRRRAGVDIVVEDDGIGWNGEGKITGHRPRLARHCSDRQRARGNAGL